MEYLKVGPEQVDDAGELGKRVGVHNQATGLIESVRSNYPPALLSAMSRPVDAKRTATLDLDEISALAEDSFTGFEELTGATVRGTTDPMVSLSYESESGRVVKAAIPYDDCPKSQKAFENAPEEPQGGDAGLKAELSKLRAENKALKSQAEAAPEPEADEPYDGYGDAKAGDVVETVEQVDEVDLLDSIEAAEEDGKNRKGVLSAIAARRDSLTETE